jgi:nicotinamidase-related amidase
MPVPNLALLVVDAQPVFLNAIPEGAALGDACRFVAATAAALDIRVAFTEQRPDKLGGTRADIRAAAKGAPVFAKSAFSAFGEEGVAEWLRDNDITHLLVAGLETPICVYQTVLGAMAEGLEVTLLTDATGGRRAADHEATLRALEKKSECHLMPSEAVFYALMGDASHGAFKAVSALVKARGAEGVLPGPLPASVVKPEPVRRKGVVKLAKKPAAKRPVRKQRG